MSNLATTTSAIARFESPTYLPKHPWWFALDRMLRRGVRLGRLEVVDAEGSIHGYGSEPGPAVRIRLHDPALYRRLSVRPSLAAGEAYTNGDLTVEQGELYDLVELYARNLDEAEKLLVPRLGLFLATAAERLRGATSVEAARRNAEQHYELPCEFYRLFLDRDLQYSCGYFSSEGDRLDSAQQNKKNHIASKLRLEPGLEVLDIGCGWGGLSLELAARYGVRVVGITLSREQLDVCTRRAKEAGLSGRARFELRDYREVNGTFDRIVSVGMFEHVGAAAYATFFARIQTLLREGGVALLHSIGRMEPPRPQDAWMRKYVFPGAHIPSLSEVLAVVEHTGLWCTDVEILRLHYAETLRNWRERFEANRDLARRRYGDAFCRKWELYLVASEVAFRRMRQMVFQMQLTRRIDAVPLTRDYMFEAERGTRRLEAPVRAERVPSAAHGSGRRLRRSMRRRAHASARSAPGRAAAPACEPAGP